VLPGGTGNDFARTLAMPASLEGCVEVLRQGATKRVDLVRITGDGIDRLSINVSAGGFSDEVADALDPEMKATWGPLAYLRAALESLPERRAYAVTLTLDGATVLQESVFNVIVANARFVAGGTQVAPYAEIDDGVFDLVVVKEVSLAGLAALASKVPSGMHLEDDEGRIVFKQVAQLEVESEPEMPFNADGEPLEGVVRRFEIVPGALEVVVPGPEFEGG
jgi:diacylglycerol kinase (ATP)